MRYLPAVLRLSLLAGLVLIGALIVSSGAGTTTASTTPPPISARDGVAIGGFDTVAYFVDREPVPGSATFAVEWQGSVWLFTSAENARLFRGEPERFAPQYGGYSLYGMPRGKAYEANPRVFDIIDGKLYLSRNDRVRAIWQRNPDGYIATADDRWAEASAEAPNQLVR
jgi:YHS domain-containing protein